MRIKRKIKEIVSINITPLIDVMFMQVLFFMVSSTLIIHQGMLVKVPEAKNSKMVQQKKLIVYLTKDDQLFVNEEGIDIKDLKDYIVNFIEKTNQKDVTIKADKEIIYEKIIRIIDICKEAGIVNISFTTKKIDKINY
ncbi:MAG TPA: biopolymer transporter ExbD [bacterium]|nr:biopolymer transporter ExbD [bacterium]HOL47580.1 biopolymer transporter ExbD [bacterium]HPQ18842.1 biopolymer transporter ExbD [bacterium]